MPSNSFNSSSSAAAVHRTYATSVQIYPHPLADGRNVLHLLLVLSMWLSTITPILVPQTLALPEVADWAPRKVALPQSAESRAPYREGMQPASVPALDTAASARSNADARLSTAPQAPSFEAPLVLEDNNLVQVQPWGSALSLRRPWDFQRTLAFASPRDVSSPKTPAVSDESLALTPAWLSPAPAESVQGALPAGVPASGIPAFDAAAPAAAAESALTPAWLSTAPAAPVAGTAATQQEPGGGFSPSRWAPLFGAGICVVPGLGIAVAPPASISQGSTTPYTFTVVITNTDYLTPTGPLSLTLQVPSNLYFIGNSARAQSLVSGTLSVVQPLTDRPGGTAAQIVVKASPEANTLPAGDVVTVTYRLAATTGGMPNPVVTNTLAISGQVDACTVAEGVSTSLCPLAVRTPMQLQIPPFLVSFGNLAGDIYTFTVGNTGVTTATDVSFEIDPSGGFFFKGGSGVLRNQGGALTLQQPPSDTLPGDPFVLRPTGAFPANTLAPGAIITGTFRLGTNGEAKSGQPLSITLRSGAAVPQVCNSTRENVPTGRGNLVIVKQPDIQSARFGDVVTWTVSVKNSGLGSVYDATFADNPGSGVRLLSITPPVTTTAEIKPDQSVLYTVTGEVNACTGLRNEGLGYWPVGNVNATGLFTNPVSDDAYLAYLFEDPDVAVTVEPLGSLEFCGPLGRSLVVTVTNNGGPARELTLHIEKEGVFSLSTASPNWVQAGNVLTYTPNGGVLLPGNVITFSLQVERNGAVCADDIGEFVLRPVFRHACPLSDPPEGGTEAKVLLRSPAAPSLEVEKRASAEFLMPGETVFYTVTAWGRNPISTAIGSILITDTLPAIFEGRPIVRSDTGSSLQVADDRYLETVITPTDTPTYSVSLFVTATLPTADICPDSSAQVNRTLARGSTCPDCLADSGYHNLYVLDPTPGPGEGFFQLATSRIDQCGAEIMQQTAAISVTGGITWTDTIYRDSLNAGGNVGPLHVVTGSVQVLVDGIDRTADLTVTTAPTLRINFDNVGAFSDSALISVTYQVTLSAGAPSGHDVYFATFTAGGRGTARACGNTLYSPVVVDIRHAEFDNLRVQPDTLNACSTNIVKLTVNGKYLESAVTDQIVVTFTASAGDVLTLTNPYPMLGGAFEGQPVAVTSGTLGSSQVVSFTFEPTLDITTAGTIAFELYRPCGVDSSLKMGLTYANQCRITDTVTAKGGETTRESNLLLRSPEVTYTLNSRAFSWQFAVRNAGDMSATNVLVTNTLPYGVHFRNDLRSGVDNDLLDAIQVVTGTINPGTPDEREVVSFTVPHFPANSSIQFIGNAAVDTCNPSDSLWIRLTQPCGGVGNACNGSQMARLGVQQGRGALLTSNTQQATIPLCSTGDVRLIVKNASAQSDLYNFSVQQVLTDVSYVGGSAQVQLVRAGGEASSFVPFTPTLINPTNPTAPFRQVLQWNSAEMGEYDDAVRELLAERGPSDQLIIQFRVRTYCTAPSPSVQASVAAVNACSTVFRSGEDSKAVEVSRPILGVQKQVKNVSEGGEYAPNVFAGKGDTLVWKIDVGNSSDVDVAALFVTDTLPAWFTVSDVYTTPTTASPTILQWTMISTTGESSPVPAQNSTTFWITGTVGDAVCADPKENVVAASYGCSGADICPASVYTAQAEVQTAPLLTLNAADATIDQCSAGPLPVTFANTGARTGAVVLTYTLPSSYQFDGLAPGTTPLPDEGPQRGVTGTLVFTYNTIGQQQITNTLLLSVTRDLSAPSACFTAATATARLNYADTCGVWNAATLQDTGKLTVLRPDLSALSQTPLSQTVVVGVPYTWTVAAPNTGSAPARNMVLTQTVGEGLQFLTATVGSSASVLVTPTWATLNGRTVITWAIGTLPPGETFTAGVAARPIVAQPLYSLAAVAHAACSDGGCRQAAAATAYNTPLQGFDKQVSKDKVSIGEPFSYTITADFYGGIAYTTTLLVDTLPQLGGKLVFSTTAIDIASTGSNGWTADTATPGLITFTTPGGSVTGPDAVTIRVTGIISNEQSAQQGDMFTNTIALDYFDEGQRYAYTDSVPAVIKEPILNLRKSVASPLYTRVDSNLYYTLVVTHAASSDATAYNVVITDAVPPAFTYMANTLRVVAPAPGTVVSTTLGNSLVVTVSEYPTPSTPITVTFMAAANVQMQPASRYVNTAYVRHTSQPGSNPNDRDGSGALPNDYWTSAGASVNSSPVIANKYLPYRHDFTIGDLITYTVVLSLPTGTTRNLTVTDMIPGGLLYLAPTSTLAVSATPPISFSYVISPSGNDGVNGSYAVLRISDTLTNTTGATAALTWTMQLLVVNDAAREVNYNGAQKLNSVTVTYLKADDTQDMQGAVAPQPRIAEPLLHIGKEYETALACSARLLADNFNDGNISDWTITRGDWTVVNGGLRAPTTADAQLVHGPEAWTDSSYSAFFVASDLMGGDVGLVFRSQGADNQYRFVWTRNALGAGGYQMIKVTNGVTSTVATANQGSRGGYTPNRWYHLELRSTGSRHVAYVDANPVLTYTDLSASPLLSGSVGFYANTLSGLIFDDALLTRLGDAGCLMDANKLVTYTLTISNQERITGYDVLITDVLPLPSLQYVRYEMQSSDGASVVQAAPAEGAMGVLAWRINQLAPLLPFTSVLHSQIVLTVTARVLGDASAGLRMPNQALVTYDGQPGSGPLGVERTYSGGSHSTGIRTPDASLVKVTEPLTATIGQRLRYTLTLPAAGGLPATMFTTTLTDVLPSGFRMIGVPTVAITPSLQAPDAVTVTRSTTKTLLVDFTRIPSNTEVTVGFDALVENVAANQSGVRYTNTATLGWTDSAGNPISPITSNIVTTTLIEPQLVVEKLATPKGVRPGDIVFYRVRVYHAVTSTAPAYNVVISDIVPAELSYISGSWPRNNVPPDVAATGVYSEIGKNLQVFFPVISPTMTVDNPLELTFQAVVDINAGLGTLITNVVTTTWQSLPTDPDGERRDGRGGVNDYRAVSAAAVSLDTFNLVKNGPLTVTAGSPITWVITFANNSPVTGTNVIVRDFLPFQVTPITATFAMPLRSGSCDAPALQGSQVYFACTLGNMPPYSSAVLTVTGLVDAATPDGALLRNTAIATLVDSNNKLQSLTDDAETQVEAVSDLGVSKRGPATAMAGDTISYTLVVTNYGPSAAHGVDVKDALPPGVTFVAGTATRGACVSAICQLGDLEPNKPVTMVITATVGAGVSGVITNTGHVFSATSDKNSANNSSSITTTVGAQTVLRVAKNDLADPVYAGNTYLYQIVVTNTGPATALNVVVTDTLPPAAILEGISPGCSLVNGQVACRAGDMLPGSWYSFLINARVPQTVTDGTVVTNVVRVGTATTLITNSSVLSDSEQTTWLQLSGSPTDLAIGKIVTPSQVTAGSGAPITYTLFITNIGPAPANGVQVSDLFPREFTLLSIESSRALTQAQCTAGGVCDLGSLSVGESARVTLTMQAPGGTAAGTYTNTAFVGSTVPDSNPANNSAQAPVGVTTSALLTLTKDAAAANVLVGELIQYRIVVSNSGPSLARAVVVSDLLPGGLANALVSSSRGCTGFPCALGDLEPGAVATILVAGNALTAGALNNVAGVTSTTPLNAASVLVDGALVTANPYSDLVLRKDAMATAVAGSLLVYTLTVTNNGPSAAQFVTVTDALPQQVSFQSADAPCAFAGGIVSCNAPTLAAGAVATYTITTTVSAAVEAGSSIENRAIVAAVTLDPNGANNLASADTSIIGRAHLAIQKQDLVDPVTAGGVVTYTIVITNEGPSYARSVQVQDRWPAGMTLESISADGGGQCAGSICQLGTVAVGSTRTITVALRTASSMPEGQVENVASVYSPDSDLAEPSVYTETTTIVTLANLRVAKSVLNDPVMAGGQGAYQVTVFNDGPSNAQAVRITDTLPVSTTYAGGDGACTASSGTVTCLIGELPAGSSRALLLNVTVDAAMADGLTLTNVVTAASPNAALAVTASVTSTVRQPQGGSVDLFVRKSGPQTVTAGELISYTLVITNRGPAVAQAVQVVDSLPAAIAVTALSSSQGACNGSVVCQLGDLPGGATASIVITGVVNAALISGTQLVNAVQVASSNVDTNPLDNSDRVTTTVESRARLLLDKEAQSASVAPGASLAYRVTVYNGGPSVARAVVVTDVLPPQLQTPLLSSSRGSCGSTSCSLGDLGPGETATILVLGSVAPLASGTIVNSAYLTTATTLDAASVVTDTATTVVGDTADLVMVKSAAPSVLAGEPITYVLTVYNTGPSQATDVQITDQLPLSTTLASWSDACTPLGGQTKLQCPSVPTTLAAGSSISFTLVVSTDAALATGAVVENRATVSSITPDPNPVNNSAAAGTTVVGQADLHVSKWAGSGTVLAGEYLTYTIVITNLGPSNAATARLVDILPNEVVQVQPVLAERTIGQTPIVCLNLVCELGAVPLGDVITLRLPVRVLPSVPHGTSFTNNVTIYSPSDPNGANNASAATAVAQRQSALVIQKSAAPDPAVTGAELLYTILVNNLGPSDADGVVVTEELPDGFSVTSVSSSQGGSQGLCSQLPCTLGVLPVGASASISIRGLVSPIQGEDLVNTARVTATSPQTATERSETTIQTKVTSSADLQLILQSTATAVAGTTAEISATVVNLGPSSAVGAEVTLTLPPGASFRDADLPDGWTAALLPDGKVLLSTAATLPPGTDIPLSITVDIAPNVASGSSLEFSGTVTSTTPDPAPSNNGGTADTSVLAEADFAIEKDGPQELLAGELVTYTIAVQNNGPSWGYLRDIKDTLPGGLEFVDAWLQNANGVTACTAGICQTSQPLPVGAVLDMVVVARVDPSLPPGLDLENTATVFADALTPDPKEDNNQATHTATSTALAQIAIDKYDLVDPVYPDALLAYMLVVENRGPSSAADVVVTDPLPAGVRFLGSTLPCTEAPAGSLTCNLGSLLPGEITSFQVMVRVSPSVPNGAVLVNTAALTSTTPLTQSILQADEETLVVVPSGPLADVEVKKAVDPSTVVAGGSVTFTLAITNNGPSPVNSVQLLDLLPNGLRLVGVSASQGFCNAGISCLLGTLNYIADEGGAPLLRGTAFVTVVAQAASDLAQEQVLVNTAYVQSERQDPVPANNQSDASVTVLPGKPQADVQIEKNDRAGVSTAGGPITYTLRVYNAGPGRADNVVVQDALPSGVTYVKAQPSPSSGLPAVPAWSLGNMKAGAVTTITLVVRSDPAALGGLLLRNTATVTTTSDDPVPSNNQAAAESQVFGNVDLEVRKTAQPTVVLAGGKVNYAITVINHGPSAAQDVDVKDLLPPGMTLTSLSASRGVCVSQICQFGKMAAGEKIVIKASAKVDANVQPGTVLTNTAAGFTDTPDTNPGNNQSHAPITVGPLVNLQVSKHSRTITATVGTQITYTMIVTNLGPSISPRVVLTDLVPAGFAYLRTTNPGGCVRPDRWYVICELGSLAAGGSKRTDLVFFIEAIRPITVVNRVQVNDPTAVNEDSGGQGEIVQPTDPKGPTAVGLASFDIEAQGDALLITWQTLLEYDSWSYRLWRNTVDDRETAQLATPTDIPARGSGSSYSFVDSNVEHGLVYYYWLQEIAISGAQKEIDVVRGGLDLEALPSLFMPLIQAP